MAVIRVRVAVRAIRPCEDPRKKRQRFASFPGAMELPRWGRVSAGLRTWISSTCGAVPPIGSDVTHREVKPDLHGVLVAHPCLLECHYGVIDATEVVIGPCEVVRIVPGVAGIELYSLFDQINGCLRFPQGAADQASSP